MASYKVPLFPTPTAGGSWQGFPTASDDPAEWLRSLLHRSGCDVAESRSWMLSAARRLVYRGQQVYGLQRSVPSLGTTCPKRVVDLQSLCMAGITCQLEEVLAAIASCQFDPEEVRLLQGRRSFTRAGAYALDPLRPILKYAPVGRPFPLLTAF